MSTHQEDPLDRRQSSIQGATAKNKDAQQVQQKTPTVTCSICGAIYAPAQEHGYLATAPRIALESAFMSICHFCFRCRRPACPNCWDDVHGVCGACTHEAQLPFRVQVTPLQGVLFPPSRQAQHKRKHTAPTRLRCIQAGRFQFTAPIESAETLPFIETTKRAAQKGTQAISPNTTARPKHRASARQNTEDIAEITTRPPKPVDPNTQPVNPKTIQHIPTVAARWRNPVTNTIPSRSWTSREVDSDLIATRPEYKTKLTDHRLERLLTFAFFLILTCIVSLLVIALMSSDANAAITQVLHVDLRAEMAYLLQLFRQILSF